MIDLSLLLGQLSFLLWFIFAAVVLVRIFHRLRKLPIFSSKN